MKVYVAAKPSGAVVGVYETLTGAQMAVKTLYRWFGQFEHEPGIWRYPDGSVVESFEIVGVEPEQVRPKRGAVVNVQINYTGLDLEAMVKEAVDKALALREWVTVMREVKRG